MFLKAPHRITAYKNCMDCRLPPELVITRWGTWLEAALFYSENFSKFKELVSNIEDDAQSVQKVKFILSTTPIISDLTFIRSHLSELPNSITKLEKQNSTLNYQINVVETVRDGLKTIENEKGEILYKKFKSVFDKNPGYNILKLYNNSINGKDVDLKEVLLTPVTVDQAREKILKVHIQTLLHGAKGRHVSWLVNVDCLVREATIMFSPWLCSTVKESTAHIPLVRCITILKTQTHSERSALFGKHAHEMQWRQCDCCGKRLSDAVCVVGGTFRGN
ncbi:hypothetical protein QTP88_018301 [Uroleucon formosanum]